MGYISIGVPHLVGDARDVHPRPLDARYGFDERIQFFIPRQSPHWAEIHDYLEHEAEAFTTDRFKLSEDMREPGGPDYYPGTVVTIRLFSGHSMHMDRDQHELLVKQATAMFTERLERNRKEREERKKKG